MTCSDYRMLLDYNDDANYIYLANNYNIIFMNSKFLLSKLSNNITILYVSLWSGFKYNQGDIDFCHLHVKGH